jgi:hypothetical protein
MTPTPEQPAAANAAMAAHRASQQAASPPSPEPPPAHRPFAWLSQAARQKAHHDALPSRLAARALPAPLGRSGPGVAAPRPFSRTQWS